MVRRNLRGPRVAHPVPRPRTVSRGAVARVGQLAAAEREAAAADALGQPLAQALELGYARVDAGGPRTGELRPVRAGRRAVLGQLRELRAHFVEGQPDPLREHDEGDPPDHRALVAPVARA